MVSPFGGGWRLEEELELLLLGTRVDVAKVHGLRLYLLRLGRCRLVEHYASASLAYIQTELLSDTYPLPCGDCS